MRPVRSPRDRPTGAPQSEREQKRFRSGTSGFSITAECGSGRGTSGTSTRPTPSLPRADAPEDEPEERTETEGEVAVPDNERESRPDTERREVDEREDRDEREDARDEDCEPLLLPRLLAPPPAIPVGGELTMPFGDTTGARPQVSQYSSPPPMSS